MARRGGITPVPVGERQLTFRGGGSAPVASAPGTYGMRQFGSVLEQMSGVAEQIGLVEAVKQAKADERALAEADDLVKEADGWADAYAILTSCVLRSAA